jgi:hypothetical protein
MKRSAFNHHRKAARCGIGMGWREQEPTREAQGIGVKMVGTAAEIDGLADTFYFGPAWSEVQLALRIFCF